MNMARILMLGGLTAGLSLPLAAQAQTAPGAAPAGPAPAATQTPNDSVIVPVGELEAGANSYTEGQARSRLEANGFSGITGLQKDDNGFWRATATHGGSSGDVALDFRGRIAHGAGVASFTPRPATSGGTTSGGISGRAAPDGTPGNPPGTAVGRAVDRATGPNTPDGTPGNPPSTVTGRAVDRAQGQPSAPDGTPGNPPGTAAGRAVDRTLGTNTTGANPPAVQR